jgi:hypothetical protein
VRGCFPAALAAHFEKLTTQVKPQPGQQQEVCGTSSIAAKMFLLRLAAVEHLVTLRMPPHAVRLL